MPVMQGAVGGVRQRARLAAQIAEAVGEWLLLEQREGGGESIERALAGVLQAVAVALAEEADDGDVAGAAAVVAGVAARVAAAEVAAVGSEGA